MAQMAQIADHLKLAISTLGFYIGLTLNCQFGAKLKFNDLHLLLAMLKAVSFNQVKDDNLAN